MTEVINDMAEIFNLDGSNQAQTKWNLTNNLQNTTFSNASHKFNWVNIHFRQITAI